VEVALGKYTKKSAKFFERIREVNGITEKQCTKCKKWKPLTDEFYYYKNKSKPEKGFQSECKICNGFRSTKNYFDNWEKNQERWDRYYDENRDAMIERDRQHRLANPEYHKMKDKRWRENNPDKNRINCDKHRDHDISEAEEQAMLKIFEYECCYCGMSLKEHRKKYGEKLHNDHVDDDGYNDLRNDAPACKTCNCSKHTENMETWYERQPFYSEERYNKIIWWITEGYKDYIEDKPPYRITKSKIDKENGTYGFQWELWSVDEKRNMVELLDIKSKKKYLDLSLA
jgi:hypothetical protein